jgi:hypothetical protein
MPISLKVEGGKVPKSVVDAAAQAVRAGVGPTRSVFVARGLAAVARLTQTISPSSLQSASAAQSDLQVLIRALQDPAILQELRREDPLIEARLRGLEAREQLLAAEGGVMSAEEVARFLRVSRQAVDKRRKAGKLIGLQAGRHGYLYPAWQFDREGTLAGLEQVLSELQHHDPWMQAVFMLSPNQRLGGRTPLQDLRRGRVEEVCAAARWFGEHGAA